MNPIVSKTDLLAYDAAGKRVLVGVDDKIINGALRSVTMDVKKYVGHAFEDDPGVTKKFQGERMRRLDFNGKCPLPPREIVTVTIGGVAMATETFRFIRNFQMNGVISEIEITDGSGVFSGEVVIGGDFGFAAIPAEVIEAFYRLVCLECQKKASKGSAKSTKATKKVKQADGTEFEFENAAPETAESTVFGDSYADSVFASYRWMKKGGVV